MSASKSRFFERVFRGQKICLRYFKICPTYFKICLTYFFFARRGSKSRGFSTYLRFVRISGRAGKRICARRAIGLRHQPGGFSRGKKLVACFLKLVARISKSEPLIFSLLPCGVNALKTSFQFSAQKNYYFRSVLRYLFYPISEP